MKIKLLYKLWGLFTGLIVIGIIVYFILLFLTSQGISTNITAIDNIKYDIGKNQVEVCFNVQVNNTGYIDVTIEKLYYKVYIENQYLGEGTKENILIKRGVNNIDICLTTKPNDAIKALFITLSKKGAINVTIEGYIDIPIKSFGIIKLWTLELPFEESQEVTLVK